MSKSIRAKMKVESVTLSVYTETVKFSAQYTGSSEDNTFASATPTANLEMVVTSESVRGHFKPGQSYYLDFTPVDSAG